MQSSKGYRTISLLVAAVLLLTTPAISTQAAEYHSTLRDDILTVTKMMETVFDKQYQDTEQELKEIIKEKDYDYTMTMETFYDNGNPFQDVDYLELITTYAAIKEYCEMTGKKTGIGIAGMNFLEMKVDSRTLTEDMPILVEAYEETEIQGIYKRNGNRVITKETQMDEFQLSDKEKGTYIRTGQKTVSPRTEKIQYGEVTLQYVGNDKLYEYFKVSKEEIEEIRQRKAEIFDAEIRGETLQQSVFVELPRQIEITEEMKALLERVQTGAYPEQQTIISTAVSLIGQVPYQWGGKASHAGYNSDWWLFDSNGQQKGLDCSGFVQWVYMTAGYDKEITDKLTSTKNMFALEDTTYEELEPGDIGLLNHGETTNHAGIYLGDGYFIHCSSSAHTVTISKFPFRYYKKVQKVTDSQLQNDTKEQYIYNDREDTLLPDALTEESDMETAVLNPEDTESEVQEPVSEENTEDEPNAAELEVVENTTSEISNEDVELLAKLIVHEAGGQGYNGKVAVGEVVINRMVEYAQSLKEVIYAPRQFSNNERIASITPDEESLSIARMLLEGKLSIFGNRNVLFFRNPKVTSGINPDDPVDWGEHTWYASINDHAFYTK